MTAPGDVQGDVLIKGISLSEICYLAHISLKLSHLDSFYFIISHCSLQLQDIKKLSNLVDTASIPWKIEDYPVF